MICLGSLVGNVKKKPVNGVLMCDLLDEDTVWFPLAGISSCIFEVIMRYCDIVGSF